MSADARVVADRTATERFAASARRLIGADGITLVMRNGHECRYVEEDAIGALWKGRSFPMGNCVSGWAMTHREQVVIPDIRNDPRVPLPLYAATFVRSLAMTPIVRDNEAIGAIGAYWATTHAATPQELLTLRALAQTAGAELPSMPSTS